MRKKTKLALVLTCCVGLLFSGGLWLWYGNSQAQDAFRNRPQPAFASHGTPAPPLTREEADLLVAVREVGLKRDRTQLPLVRRALKESHPFLLTAAVLAAGRLGDTESLPAMEAIAQRRIETREGEVAKAALAYVKAESAVGRANSAAAFSRKVNHFLSAAGLSAARIRGAAQAYAAQKKAGGHGPMPFELHALRCAADLVMEASEAGVSNAASLSGLDFSLDYPAQLKVKLAPMSHQERIAWLVELLSKKKAGRWQEDYEMQALADEGLAASQAIIAKLQEMKAHRDQYPYHPGFVLLFRTLTCLNDPDAIPAVRSFLNDDDRWVRHYAQQALGRLEGGVRVVRAVDY